MLFSFLSPQRIMAWKLEWSLHTASRSSWISVINIRSNEGLLFKTAKWLQHERYLRNTILYQDACHHSCRSSCSDGKVAHLLAPYHTWNLENTRGRSFVTVGMSQFVHLACQMLAVGRDHGCSHVDWSKWTWLELQRSHTAASSLEVALWLLLLLSLRVGELLNIWFCHCVRTNLEAMALPGLRLTAANISSWPECHQWCVIFCLQDATKQHSRVADFMCFQSEYSS